MGFGKILKNVSPMYGAMTGKGTFGGLNKISPTAQIAKAVIGKNKKPGDATSDTTPEPMAKGGKAKCYRKGGSIDGVAKRGKTKGRFV